MIKKYMKNYGKKKKTQCEQYAFLLVHFKILNE